ncbi:glycosyltransferase [Acidianus sp. RZ1]|uniref:glycosyltransferase n=1 Tax=Acidianus sp. RZ1 TaxID=1540082 RepID=UPI0020A3D521|nr:glycosyltransferase [Acidianus sp. RZ1]
MNYNKKIFVVNPFIDDKFFKEKKRNATEKKEDIIKIGYIGKIDSERKNVLRAIRAFKNLRENALFELWGNHSTSNKIMQEIIKEIKKDKRIRLMGPAPEEDLIKIYDSFDAFFLPSKEEGFGYPIVEAQSRGIPVIVFEDADIPEEVCKYCLKINNDLNEIIDKISDINRNALISFAQKFNVNAYVKNLVNMYNEIIK